MDLQVCKFSLGYLDAKSFFQNLSWKASHDGKSLFFLSDHNFVIPVIVLWNSCTILAPLEGAATK
jgi:hypothetical protein